MLPLALIAGGLIGLLINLLVFALIASLIFWIIGLMPLQQPFRNIVLIIFGIIAILILISMIYPVAL